MTGDAAGSPADFVERLVRECPDWHLEGRERFEHFVDECRTFEPEAAKAVLIELFRVAAEDPETPREQWVQAWPRDNSRPAYVRSTIAVADTAGVILRRKLPLTPTDIAELIDQTLELDLVSVFRAPQVKGLVLVLERRWDELSADPDICDRTRKLASHIRRCTNASEIRLARRVEALLDPTPALPLQPGEAWTDRVHARLNHLGNDAQAHWFTLLSHCATATGSKPSARWLKAARDLLGDVGKDALVAAMLDWFPLVDLPRTAPPPPSHWREEPVMNQLILEEHGDVLKGLCWIAATLESEPLARALGSLAISSYRKVPGIGPRLIKVGNAAVYALGQIPGEASLGQLAMLRIKIKFGTAQKVLDKALDAAAAREGIPRDEVEEMAVPAYGLSSVGAVDEPIGEHVAQLRVAGTSGAVSTKITWKNAAGKVTKSVPAAVKSAHADELKELKAAAKDIQKMLPAQRDRIDAMFLDRKAWPMHVWRQRYLDHPLVGTIARRLIWLFDIGDTSTAAAWLADDPAEAPHGPGRLVGADGDLFEPAGDGVTVRLWHPIDEHAPPGTTRTRDDVLAWREFYESRGIQQPFKQAHREVYLLTDAERRTETYSNRFAAHVLRQHQTNALAAQRGWKARLRLMVDDEYPPPTRTLDAWGLRAEFWVEGVGDDWVPEFVLESGAFRFLATDQVRFYTRDAAATTAHAGGGGYHSRGPEGLPELLPPLALDRVPPIVLSEVLRDVDLFVGVGSVGNNPEWNDGGPGGHFADYWTEYSFGDLSGTAETRRDLLARLVPRLKIADACTVADRFLIVRGTRRTYKIHLGSGNILMEPNDQYLCIIPSASMESKSVASIALPFEGDRTLAVILSKAFLLAADDTITDRSILSQID